MTESEIQPAVLYVDDEFYLRELSQLLIMSYFPQVVFYSAPEGQRALNLLPEVVNKHSFRLVIMSDVQMPGMSGPQLVEQVRSSKDPRIAEARIIMHTSMGGSFASVLQFLRDQLQGRTDFEVLRKPFDETEFVATVTRALSGLR